MDPEMPAPMMAQSAVLVPVPEAERAVSRHRTRLDRAAAWGVPAHVTILYPFVAPSAITAAPIWYLDPHCPLCTNREEDPPGAIAGTWPRGVRRAGQGAGAVAAVHGPERAGGEGGSCRTWEPSTS